MCIVKEINFILSGKLNVSMKFFKNAIVLFIVCASLLIKIDGVSAALTNICPGEPKTLNWSSSNVTGSCQSSASIPSCYFSVNPNTAQSSIINTSQSCNVALTCDGVTDTDSLSINPNQSRCCGNWDLASYPTWNGTSCVAAASYPDLTAGGVSPWTATTNSPVTLSSTISNIGSVTSGTGFTVLFQYALNSSGSGATDLGTTNTTTLLNGASRPVSYTYTPGGAGTYYLRACADKSSGGDATGVINENTNEGNNCSGWSSIVISCPAGTSWNGSACVAGPSAQITVPSCTIPLSASSCSSSVSWNSQNLTSALSVQQNSVQFSTLSSSAGTSRTLQYGSGATNTFTAVHNGTTLDTKTGTASCVSGTSWNGSACIAAAGASCSAMGTQTWLTNCSASVPGATDGGQSTVSNTASGYTGSATWTCNNGTWSGPSSTSCTADAVTAVTINVRATSPIAVEPSSSFTFPFTYTISDGSTSGRCRLLDSGSSALTSYTAMTSPNSIAWTAPSTNGQYTYYVQCRKGTSSTIVDQDNVIVKVCPSGLIWSTISNACVPPSDLTAGPVTPATASVGVTTTFYSRISNIGGGSTDGTFKNFMQYSVTNPDTDINADIRDLNSTNMSTLVAGASATTTSSRRYTSAGTYYMRACADKDKPNDTGNINESNENNNCGAWTPVCVGTAAQCQAAAPQVINPLLIGNNSTPGTLSFSCLNSTLYSITRTEGASGIYPITNAAYTGPISSAVSVSGNYNLICSNGSQSDTVTIAYNSAPVVSNISLVATPSTAKAGTMSTLSWIIGSPTNSCAITASAVYTTGAGPDATRNADAASLTSLLANPNKTDKNDPYGERPMNTALRNAAPGVTGKAVGKKSVLLQYTTDFLLNCGSSTRKVRVQVTNENEG